jgi:ubiquinone/menaquinone biosynthesis C-methylase UbiE
MEETQRKGILKETFNTISDKYDSKALRFFLESADYFASILRLRGDEQVLDVATGTGHATLTLSEHLPQGHITGIDFSRGMLEQAKRKATLLNINNVKFLEMDMQAMDFPTDQFDVAICAFGIFFVDDMESQLRHISEMVKSGGTIAICTFHENYFQPLRDLMIKRLTNYNVKLGPQTWKRIATKSACRDLFEKVDIRDVRVEQKNIGYFLDNEKEWWDIIWNAGFRRLISQLQPSDMEQFQKEHMQEVAALATKNGIWIDIGVLYTLGRK